jgi:hypothetical protein
LVHNGYSYIYITYTISGYYILHIIQGGAPSYEWVIIPLTIDSDISPINHSL